MSVAIDASTTAQISKDTFDSEFDIVAEGYEFDDEDLEPVKACIWTCGISCVLTG